MFGFWRRWRQRWIEEIAAEVARLIEIRYPPPPSRYHLHRCASEVALGRILEDAVEKGQKLHSVVRHDTAEGGLLVILVTPSSKSDSQST